MKNHRMKKRRTRDKQTRESAILPDTERWGVRQFYRTVDIDAVWRVKNGEGIG